MKVIKKFGVDFYSEGGALTLDSDNVSDSGFRHGEPNSSYTKVHSSGWTITGAIQEDYYEWVNDFIASHLDYGVVQGDFEAEVVATSEEAFQHFYKNHTPTAWDYGDI